MAPKKFTQHPEKQQGSEKQQGAQKNDRVFGKTRGHCTPSFMARVDTVMH